MSDILKFVNEVKNNKWSDAAQAAIAGLVMLALNLLLIIAKSVIVTYEWLSNVLSKATPEKNSDDNDGVVQETDDSGEGNGPARG